MPEDGFKPLTPARTPRPTSLKSARRLFAELNNPVQVETPQIRPPDGANVPSPQHEPATSRPRRQGFPRVPGHHIERIIGEGGGGTVYLAYRDASDRPIALKILNARPGEQSAQRAWRELDLLTQIHLPNVPRVLDYGRVETGPFVGRLYIATEFIDGEPIDRHCHVGRDAAAAQVETSDGERSPRSAAADDGPPKSLELRTCATLLARTADALHALHERGVIHRDIKPANILIDRNGDPVIIDLGIATLVASDVMETLTHDGAPIGSPAYMAPEQARGDRHLISIRSDVYALGATAFYVLTGATPHDLGNATLHEAIHCIASQPPRDPRSVNPNVPKPLSAILVKALAPDPKERYVSAAAFADDLRRWLNAEPVEAGKPTPWRTISRWIARHPIAATTLVCAAIVVTTLIASVAAVDYLNNRPHRIIIKPDNSSGSTSKCVPNEARPKAQCQSRSRAFPRRRPT